VVSTDGDSDRPLILGVEGGRARFFGGDLVGMIVAEYLGADAVVVPISCNDAIDRGPLAPKLEPKTRIGSPYVIAGMEAARARGRRAVCGWEANGGFLTGSDIERNGAILKALPTRDAMLPILCTLFAMVDRGGSLCEIFGSLPARYSKAALLRRFPRPTSQRIVARFSPSDPAITDVDFGVPTPVPTAGMVRTPQVSTACLDAAGAAIDVSCDEATRLATIRRELSAVFGAVLGVSEITRLNYVDGVRLLFANGDVAHVRPSGNADELRIYAVSDTQARADVIASLGVATPDGILHRLARAVEPVV
jgi:phosphomannomutase